MRKNKIPGYSESVRCNELPMSLQINFSDLYHFQKSNAKRCVFMNWNSLEPIHYRHHLITAKQLWNTMTRFTKNAILQENTKYQLIKQRRNFQNECNCSAISKRMVNKDQFWYIIGTTIGKCYLNVNVKYQPNRWYECIEAYQINSEHKPSGNLEMSEVWIALSDKNRNNVLLSKVEMIYRNLLNQNGVNVNEYICNRNTVTKLKRVYFDRDPLYRYN